MATGIVTLADIERLETTETGGFFAARNMQSFYATDTKYFCHKYSDGSIVKYPPESALSLYGQTGVDGPRGATGLEGAPGVTGVQGQTGVSVVGGTGLIGSTGVQGQTGAQGHTGGQGQTGLQGAAGAAGAVGQTGAQGYTGASGITGYTGMRITEDGTLQVRYFNSSGSSIYDGFLLCVDENGVTGGYLCLRTSSEDSERIVGVSDHGDAVVNNGEFGWCTVKGITKVYTGYWTSVDISAGDIVGQAPTYALANAGRISGITNKNWKGIGYALGSAAAEDILLPIYFNGPTFGIQNFYYAPIQNVTGVTDDVVLLYYVIDGGNVNIEIDGIYVDKTATDTIINIVVPAHLYCNNLTYANVSPINYNIVNHGNVISDHVLVMQYDSTIPGWEMELWNTNTGVLSAWTGTCGWYYDFNINYIKTV